MRIKLWSILAGQWVHGARMIDCGFALGRRAVNKRNNRRKDPCLSAFQCSVSVPSNEQLLLSLSKVNAIVYNPLHYSRLKDTSIVL